MTDRQREVAQLIKKSRLDLGLSQRAAALKFGVSRETFRIAEATGTMPASPRAAKAIADLCATTVTELWPESLEEAA